jgi:hypothetical protein
VPQPNAIAKADALHSQSIELRAETASAAVAAQAEAMVKARYAIAVARPRDWDAVRQRLLAACRRPRFAEAAIYSKPIGKDRVTGPSVRFAEECARSMGNIEASSQVIYDDASKRITRVAAIDLETNTPWVKDVVVEKIVERRDPRGRDVLGKRTNTSGEVVYIVRATEDDLLNKQAALESKAQRGNILRIVPADIVEEALDVCREVRKQEDARDPDAARKKLLDAFASIGVKPADLKTYLGTPLDGLQPAQLDELRAIYTTIRDGEARWADYLARAAAPAPNARSGVAGLRDDLAARRSEP